ncbi:MAG: exosortase A [Burkholderiaceae bacterium]|nr:exosortase A [Burkholderiaceae bacterium]
MRGAAVASRLPHDAPDAVSGPMAQATPSRRWVPVFAAFVFACLLSIAAFPDAWLSMAYVWWTSDTFAHGFIALPCAAWMIWRRRDDWAQVEQRAWWPGLAAVLGCGALWLAGRLGGVASIEELAAVAAIPATLLLLAGPSIVRALAFPLAFLFFAVPIGEFLTPIMMDYTADATVMALRWSGVPVYREGLHFMVPTGRWSVVEACSGLRYLIASLALGVLYAYLQFRTLRYRLMFIAMAVAVPIVANWIRAYMIVMLGHLSGMRIATGVDHLVYGWVFFGIVMAAMFWFGSRWREPATAEPAPPAEPSGGGTGAPGVAPASLPTQGGAAPRRPVVIAALVAAAAVLAWRPVAGAMLAATHPIQVGPALRAALAAFPEAPALPFEPAYFDAREAVRLSRSVDGQPVDVHAFYYARQHESQEMIHARNTLVKLDDPRWSIRSSGSESTPFGQAASYRLVSPGGAMLLVWHWYAVDGWQSPSAYRAKAATAWSLATGHGDHSVAVTLATPIGDEGGAAALQSARSRLAKAATALAPAVDAASRGRTATAGAQ